MQTTPSQSYDTAIQRLMARGLSHDDAVQMLERFAQGRLTENAHALERYGLEYVVALGALSAARGEVAPHLDDADRSHGLSANTLVILSITLGGIGYYLSKSSYAHAVEHGQQTLLIFRGLFTASAVCLCWAGLKWLRS